MFILDTNTLIYFFKGMGSVGPRLLSIPPSEIAVPSIVVYELEVGLAKSNAPAKRREQLDRLLNLVQVLPFDSHAAKKTAEVRVTLETAGTPIGPHDVQIAGIALVNDGILVTHNLSEFSRVSGLRLEDWF